MHSDVRLPQDEQIGAKKKRTLSSLEGHRPDGRATEHLVCIYIGCNGKHTKIKSITNKKQTKAT